MILRRRQSLGRLLGKSLSLFAVSCLISLPLQAFDFSGPELSGHSSPPVPAKNAGAAEKKKLPAAPLPADSGQAALVELDGSSSQDPDGDKLNYEWKQLDGPSVVLSDAASAKPYFRTRLPGLYRFELVVSDGARKSEPAVVEVRVERPNTPPVADLPATAECQPGQELRIDASASRDADGDHIAFRWRQTAGPPLYLPEQALREETLGLRIEKPGVYEFELVLFDGQAYSLPARCRVSVRPPNRAPIARAAVAEALVTLAAPAPSLSKDPQPAGAPVVVCVEETVVTPGDTVRLDASKSYSPLGRKIRYFWTQQGGPFVAAFERPEGDESRISFTPEETGDYAIDLVVSDGDLDSAPRRLLVRVVEGNRPPVAQIVAPATVWAGERLDLDGTRSYDRENRRLVYTWRQTGGPAITEAGTPGREAHAVFYPREPGAYLFSLVVSDGEKESAPAVASVLVKPRDAAPEVSTIDAMTVGQGESFLLTARGRDPEGAPLRYRWRQVGGPEILKAEAEQQSLQLTAAKPGTLRFEVTASDGTTESAPAVCRVRVVERELAAVEPRD